jgi:hypothetical protein
MPLQRVWLALILVALAAPPALAQRKPKPKPPTVSVATLRAQVASLTTERDDLKAQVGTLEKCPEELASALRSRDLARAEASGVKRELDQLRASLRDDQKGGEALLAEAQRAKADLATCRSQMEGLRQQLEEANARLQGTAVQEGTLVPLSPDITPARPLNLDRVTPSVKKVGPAVVVVNVLVSEKGDALETRLLQGLRGDSEWVRKAHEACLEAAKRLVFDPARAGESKVRVKVWQGVGFYLD